jgi:type II secretory ATPase GspE/PulE/Tfp pilus assembly ATPase PilB-like protein
MVVHELMMIDDEIRNLIMNKADSSIVKKEAIAKGMISLRNAGIQKVLDKISTAVELVAVTQE